MRYQALATDYDGTLARDGRVAPETLDALDRLKDSGRKLVLVTGRILDDLAAAFPDYTRFDRIVAENGAVVHRPDTGDTTPLGAPPPAELVAGLRRRGITPLDIGQVIIATRTPHEKAVLDTIREAALDNHVSFNKGAVMVLPPGMNKAKGLSLALDELAIPPESVVGIGDAENDHAFLALCGRGIAVADAIPSVIEDADWVTPGGAGTGVVELIERLLATDLADLPAKPEPSSAAARRPAGYR